MLVGIAADHGGFGLKNKLLQVLEATGHRVQDYGAYQLALDDDYPDFVLPMALAVARGKVDRGIAICNSGVGACVAANKIRGVRAGQITDSFSAHQGVEDDGMNVMCLGAGVVGESLALELIHAFLNARFRGEERFRRRLSKIRAFEEAQEKPKGGA